MSKFHAWLWPDHAISKSESRQLREEQNALINSHAELLEALGEMVAHLLAHATYGLNEQEVAMLNKAERAIAKAKG